MAELIRIETDRASFVLSGPRSQTSDDTDGLPTGHLRIIAKQPGLELKASTYRAGVPDLAAPDLAQRAGPRIFEETQYTVLLASRHAESVELRHRDPVLLSSVESNAEGTQRYGTINFRSQVGFTRLSAYLGGRPAFDVELEVFPSKVGYRSDYASMMGDVQDLAAGLALEYLRATHQLGAATAGQDSSRLDWMALLRHVVDVIAQAVDQIARRPLKSLRREARMVRVEALRRSDGTVRKAVRSGVGRGPRVTLSSGIPVRRYLPERRPLPTLDTPEHRWLATQLQLVRRRLARIADDEQRRLAQLLRDGQPIPRRDQQALDELAALEVRIARLERVEPLAAAEGPPPSGFASLQLQDTPGYREAYRNLLILRVGLRITGGPVELSVKDVHLLYEYWCFLGIVRLVSEILETDVPPDSLLEVREDGMRIRLQKGRKQAVPFQLPGGRALEVTYNPSFRDSDALLDQQPDIVLTFTDPNWPTIRLVLDAKYRLKDDGSFVEHFGAPGPPPDAVNVLHRYRDAIIELEEEQPGPFASRPREISSDRATRLHDRRRTVIEGAALFPLSADAARSFDGSRFWTSLQRLGIGALPFLPESRSWVERWLRAVLQRSGWDIADAVISHAAELREAHWKRAAERAVLIGVLRGSAPAAHLEWIREHGIYYTKHTKQPRQLQNTTVALYEPARLNPAGGVGVVRLCVDVQSIDVERRGDIPTPWAASRNVDELQVVYRLGAFRQLDSPVENRSGQRMNNRWSSALALERARDITEFLLESLIEWRLYDALRARGVEFELRALRVREEAGKPKRVSFRTGDRAAWWKGGADFEVSVHGKTRTVDLARAVELLGGLT